MAEVKVKGRHQVEVRSPKGDVSLATVELKYRRIHILPPIGKQKRYPALEPDGDPRTGASSTQRPGADRLEADHGSAGTIPRGRDPDARLVRHALEGRDGLITNDKFCLSRFRQLKLSWWRLPLRLRETCLLGCPSLPNLSAAGGNDAGVADAPDMPASSGRAAPVGSDLSAIDGMDKAVTRRRGSGRPRASRTGGEP